MSDGQKRMQSAYDCLASWDLSQLAEEDLLLLFHQENWKRMNKEQRLQAMQEVENRRARADGRPPVEIIVEGNMPPENFGGYQMRPDGGETIRINRRFVTAGKLFSGADTSIYNGASALATVLHEGRHAFQCHAVRNGLGNIAEQVRREWAAVMPVMNGLYNNQNPVIYMLQSIEMDARRFSRRKIMRIYQFFKTIGAQDPNFENYIVQDLQEEALLISLVRAHMTREMIDQYEEMVKEHFKRTHPEIDLSALGLFDHVRFILDHPEIQNPLEMLKCLDRMADEKLAMQDGANMNRFKNPGLNGLKR